MWIYAVLWGVVLAAFLIPAALVTHGRHPSPNRQVHVAILGRVIPHDEPPPLGPVLVQNLSAMDARAFNTSVPFTTFPIPPARPFVLSGAGDLARATDCLAAAIWYEAGDDPPGERAVAQVVLNRVRHPVFPKTVCEVVFQGSERSTGCQFTFICDGSMSRRRPTDAAWSRARGIAAAALGGAVYKPVGWATFYHADYVVPYWGASLDKLVKVHTQLFYRWTGWWGSPAAFSRQVASGEPTIAQLAPLSIAHREGVTLPAASGSIAGNFSVAEAGIAAAPGVDPVSVPGDENSFLVTIPPGTAPETYPMLAAKACGDREICRYAGWLNRADTPTTLPMHPTQIATMTFSYLRDCKFDFKRQLWNCRQVTRPNPTQCMDERAFQLTTPQESIAEKPATPSRTPRDPTELGGVQIKKHSSSD